METRNPPKNRKMSGCAYAFAETLNVLIPEIGKIISGKSAVTAKGIASVIHQMAIHSVTAIVMRTLWSITIGVAEAPSVAVGSNSIATQADNGPASSAINVKFRFI